MDFAPEDVDRKGSLSLRSNTLGFYSRPTLTSNWYQRREAEPKDYDIDDVQMNQKNLRLSTYKRFGTREGDWSTTTNSQMNQINLKDDYNKKIHKLLMNKEAVKTLEFKRDTGYPENYRAVLPRHSPDHNKFYSSTTYNDEFYSPYTYTPAPPEVIPNKGPLYRKCISQFMEPANHRREGRNTWQDESGAYANSELKDIFHPPINPIPTRCD
ncbi:protein C9orf135 [Callorhinchus milii]|uniref:Uncharacterized protein n=2 Tax=Callorhinchus milii TaxID=7868 RepID=A0A4W3I2W4_CALMI|nr:protein C9orf135 [Callorhinchus milii]|eukprot:gi/632976386/ref/XP_007904767.1/ PREDICTED: uncharacterized protein C9orf135 homolog [Callorhinchus milii]